MKRRPLVVGLAALAVFFVLDRGIAFVLSQAFERLHTGEQAGLANYAIHQTDAQVVVFGSSRAVYHIDPAVLRRDLSLSAFNAGLPGQGIRYARAIEALLLQRGSHARLFVLNVDPRDLWESQPARLQRLAPFYGRNAVVDALLEESTPTAWIKLRLRTYRYNGLVLPILANWLRSRPDPGDGFRTLPPDRPQDLRARSEPQDPGPVHEDMSRLFAAFIDDARAQGIRVALVDGPRWAPDGPSAIDRIGHAHLAALARRHGAAWILIDEENDPFFRDARYFADVAHLTHEGAEHFSQRLAEALRPIVAGVAGPAPAR